MNSSNPGSDPKVSVVVTCYKYAHFLPLAMDSALNQTYRNVEVIMVNDGSPDNTDEVMQRYASDPRVVYIKQENAGQAIAKNNGIKRATGAFIAFLDADDIWELDKLEKQMKLFSNPAVGVVYCRVKYMDENGAPAKVEERPEWAPVRGRITNAIFRDNLVPFCAAVVRRTCFDTVGMMDPSFRMGIDWDLWLRMSVQYEFDFVDERLLNYRVGHAGQMSKNYAQREKDTMRIMNQFIAHNPGLLSRSQVRWAYAYSYTNRGDNFRRVDRWRSAAFYLKAIKTRWVHFPAYIGLAKWMGRQVLQPLGLKR